MWLANTANKIYIDVLAALISNARPVGPRGMGTREIAGRAIWLADARNCVVTFPERRLNYHFMVAEFWWILAGRDDVAAISPYCREIAKFSDDGERFFGAYGPPWRDQIGGAIERLKKDRETRQAVVTYWRPNPPATKDVPCTIATQYLARDGALHAITTMRSWDAWLGFPYDVFNQSRLLAAVAGEIGLTVGSLTIQAGSLHLYDRDAEKARALVDLYKSSHLLAALRLDPLPGLISTELAHAYELRVRAGELPVIPAPWNEYVGVLVDRFHPGAAGSYLSPFAALLDAEREGKVA